MQNLAIKPHTTIKHPPAQTSRPAVRCPHCGHAIFDGLVIKSRIVRVLPMGAEAKCQCKAWVAVPIHYNCF